ncbi:hypothetical protein H310_02928 [Aphanomyces invadans]|uniref:C2H2-type domain-containing protein n=1 Tax=Aphanomyces invadans TaxID=157072 RepID=A0A024UKQ3_9STRA|nr:hypothetical protein H310_02928 [Aphanomyces invadans]ETW06770.1 hypothetical protein H310_02928 [Aphanomyces invadans]|eukprot:XP_008864845.1 hypothetical protein H310_02928 [Aphanomyces invadans]
MPGRIRSWTGYFDVWPTGVVVDHHWFLARPAVEVGMASDESKAEYVCRMCRALLFTSDDLMEHEPQRHQISQRKKLKEAKLGAVECSSYFLSDTKEWMDEASLAEGKLFCPVAKCNSRLGSFGWSGSQCSCGTWVTPSVQFTKSRVDVKVKMAIPAVFVPVVEAAAVAAPGGDSVVDKSQGIDDASDTPTPAEAAVTPSA